MPTPQVDFVDWDAKRLHLHFETTLHGFDAWEAFREVRELHAANANGEQNYELFLQRQGKVAKGGGRFTPRFVQFKTGWRVVPHDSDHFLAILVEMISDDEVSDRDVFDRSTVNAAVDIDSTYDQVEVLEITTGGGGFTASDRARLELLEAAIAGKVIVNQDGTEIDIYSADGVTVQRKLTLTQDQRERDIAT